MPAMQAVPEDLISAIESAAGRAWPPIEREPLDGWVLRCGRAGSRRLNSVQTLAFNDGANVEQAIGIAEEWYRARRLPPCFQVVDLVRPGTLDDMLAARGHTLITPTSVMIARDWPASASEGNGVELVSAADDRVLRAICDTTWSAEKKRERVDLFARIESAHVFALVLDSGEPIAGGMCAVDGTLAGLFTMRTQLEHRGRGLARAIALRLIAWARQQGAQQLYLQVEDDNVAALRLYRQLGFARVYGYHYRERA